MGNYHPSSTMSVAFQYPAEDPVREDERLCALLAQIQGNPQGSPSSVQLEADDEGRATKRSRYENRLTNSLDSSESAAGEFPSGYGDHCSVLNNCAPDDDYFCTS